MIEKNCVASTDVDAKLDVLAEAIMSHCQKAGGNRKFEVECISATIDNGVLCNELVNVPKRLRFSPDQVHKCDVHTDAITFN